MEFKQTHAPSLVPKHDQILSQDPDNSGQLFEIFGMHYRLPEATEVLSTGGPGSYMGQLRVLGKHR